MRYGNLVPASFQLMQGMLDCDEGPKSSGIDKKRKTLIFFEKALLVVKQFSL
jgi:hypothetical protein